MKTRLHEKEANNQGKTITLNFLNFNQSHSFMVSKWGQRSQTNHILYEVKPKDLLIKIKKDAAIIAFFFIF